MKTRSFFAIAAGLTLVAVVAIPVISQPEMPEPVVRQAATEQVINVWVGFQCLEEDGSLSIRVSNALGDPALEGCKDRQLHEMTLEQWQNR